MNQEINEQPMAAKSPPACPALSSQAGCICRLPGSLEPGRLYLRHSQVVVYEVVVQQRLQNAHFKIWLRELGATIAWADVQ